MATEKLKGVNIWLLSIILNGLVMLVTIAATNMAYETNDDFAVSLRIVGGYPYVGFVNYYLCRILIAIQSHVSILNVYVIFLIAISFISFTYVTKIIIDKCKILPICLMILSTLIIYSFDHYCAIQFTKTAALVVTGGFIALVDSVISGKGIGGYTVALALIYTGTAIRYEVFLVTLGMAAVAVLVWMLIDRKKCLQDGWFKPERLLATAVMAILIGGSFGLMAMSRVQNTSTPALKYADDYNYYRTNIVDFSTYEYYDQNRGQFEKIGISKNDLYLIDKWFFDYDGAASYENLKRIDSIERPQKTISSRASRSIKKSIKYVLQGIKGLSSNGIHVLVLIFLACGMIVSVKPRRWLYIIAIGGVSLGVYVSLHFIQRVNYRSLYVADIGAMLWLLYYYAHCIYEDDDEERSKFTYVIGIVLLVASILSTMPLNKNCESKYNRATNAVMSKKTEEFFLKHNEEAYVWATGEKKLARSYATPWLAPDDKDENVFNTGSWNVMTPFVLDKLNKYGMQNPIKDLINNEKAFFISKKYAPRVEEYLNKWYAKDNEEIEFEKSGTVDGYNVWRVKLQEKN